MSAELFRRRFALFRNLSPPTVNGDILGCDPENMLQTIVYFIDTFCFKIIFNKEGFLAYN